MNDFSSTLTLENERVLLRPLRIEDFPLLLPFALSEPNLWTYSISPAAGKEHLKSYIDQALKGREDAHTYPFIVFDKSKGKAAGSTRFYDINSTHNTLSLGYTWYGKAFQRTGLNRNCKWLLLSYAFDDLGVERVEFRADARNEKSITSMKELGCTLEGILRNNCQAPKGRRDSVVLSILKSEWNSGLKERLQSKIY